MLNKPSLLPLIILLAVACTDAKKHAEDKHVPVSTDGSGKPASGLTDTLIINFPTAVFFEPDSMQWEKIKQVTDTATFDSFEHDCFYQMRNARKVLKEYYPQVKITETVSARYLLFEMNNGSLHCIDLDKVSDPCGIFLFTPEKEPHPADMTNIDTELGFYFKKKN
jgi:hypothetical protein